PADRDLPGDPDRADRRHHRADRQNRVTGSGDSCHRGTPPRSARLVRRRSTARPAMSWGGSAQVSELYDLTATEKSELLRAGKVSAVELTEACLRRIEEVNGPVNAIVTVVADHALEQARQADADLAQGRIRGPLHGIPVAHKDLADTAGIRTTYGSRVFADRVPEADDPMVRRIKAAGGITIGKTNTPEFGTGSHTVNEVFGATRNPYDLSKSAGGSSGGAAAALACRMVPLADGSDMGGSLRNPASFCNVTGLRPTPG